MPKADNDSQKSLDLSAREAEVLKWVACGKTNSVISEVLSVSENTVRAHVKSICHKLKADNKPHAVAIALTHHVLLPRPSPERVIALPILFGLLKRPHDQRGTSGASSYASRLDKKNKRVKDKSDE